MRVLIVTSEWPCEQHPESGIFVVRQARALRALGVEAPVFAFRGKTSIRAYFRAYRDLRARLSVENFDAVHAHFGQAGLLACLASRIPTVVTFHGSDAFGLGRRNQRLRSALLRFASALAARLAAAIIVVSPDIQTPLHTNRAHVIPMGIDRRVFSPIPKESARTRLVWPKDEVVVLFVGDPKNPIKRFELAQRSVEEAMNLVQRPIALRVCNSVSPQDMPLYLNAADALLITSEHEGGPLILREALACNLPVVSVDIGDARQRLSRVPGCALIERDTPEEVARGLVAVLTKKTCVSGEAGIADLDDHAIAARVLNVYHEAVAENRRLKLTGRTETAPTSSRNTGL